MSRPKVIIDTNVLVSAALKTGSLEEAVVLLIAANQLELFISPPLVTEYKAVLHRPRLRLAAERVDLFLQLILSQATSITPREKVSISPHDDDNRFLECAQAAGADFLITGNKRHFPKIWKTSRIVNARELLDVLKTP